MDSREKNMRELELEAYKHRTEVEHKKVDLGEKFLKEVREFCRVFTGKSFK